MGAVPSSLLDCSIDENPILTTKDWTLHHAQKQDNGPLSVFINKNNPDSKLSTLAQSLKTYRHPSILSFLAWSETKSQAYLFTEKACPLTLVLGQQSSHSISLGLLEICQALQFLHDKGNLVHGNICQNALFITPAGRWKIAGLEQVIHIPDNKMSPDSKQSETSRDVLALGLVITELLLGLNDEPSKDFLVYTKSHLLLPDLTRRPTISQVLEHPYFHQPHIEIFQFLKDLTLKLESEKKDFFLGLGEKLGQCPARVLGAQFTGLLLSRYVLMDSTARSKLIPKLLEPQSKNSDALFTDELFKEFIVPQIRTMFLVYDMSVRLVLLQHFSVYSSLIDVQTLEDDILPALLLGLKDLNPNIVSETLRALADLVPILGPEIVIGRSRSKIFSDGSPNHKITPVLSSQQIMERVPHSQRVPPIGAEQDPLETDHFSGTENWDDWEDEEENEEKTIFHTEPDKLIEAQQVLEPMISMKSVLSSNSEESHRRLQSDIDTLVKNVQDLDILKLDIKVPSKIKTDEEVDFFADMTPNIPKQKSSLEKFQTELDTAKQIREQKFAAVADLDTEEGWGDEELEW
ncbi:protein-associating with the carboxyl-terminal domain of ezrin-like [Eurytemora carolleeae]|uniref:protein-associating with the carboxyl-terminal domain of ezrin-like n=1 Tax=Eurytemora carolleeae TaxID=1294199 RepID=UPI000C7874AA|nr:protein-associating with the carboxyl-terminal domain of ezrin-like [Eurytemora carolleeae]|eukprot:XP_023331824.1 protein-associating with the carboxyl-terminal domain of ezrin-like [Eurytemora affinis]